MSDLTKTNDIELERKEYFNDLNKIKETIKQNQNKAMVYVNSQMILTYYEIGTIINERKKWGSKYIEKLSEDLKVYGKGYGYEQLKRMSRFSVEFSLDEIRSQPVTQIPWSTLTTVIMSKSKTHEEMLWYINQVHKNGWSRAFTLNQIALKAYERSLIKPISTEVVNDAINEVFKDTYVFDFLDKEKIKTEKDLKNQMIDNVIKFLQEMGHGFSLVGKEYEITTPDKDNYFIDILMYHLTLHAYVVIEVKIGKFHPADFGELSFYVNAIDDLIKTNIDDKTIGLILCKDANEYVAKTTIQNSNSSTYIAKYKFVNELTDYLNKMLKDK